LSPFADAPCLSIASSRFVSIQLFERVLHGASSNDAGEVEMKLSLRRMPNGGDVVSRPYLTFQTVGTLSITSELPISKPFPSSEVDSLVRQIRSDQACPFYVDLMPVVENLNSSLQTLKKLSNACQVTLTRTGDAHVQAFRAQSGCVVGVEYRGMEVVPEDQRMADDTEVVQEGAPTGRLQKAVDLGLGATLSVPTKQMAKIVSVCQYTKPSKLLCGIGQNAQCLHFVYAYLDQRGGGLTDTESMSVKLAAFAE